MSTFKKTYLFTVTLILLISATTFAFTPNKITHKKENTSFVYHQSIALKKLTLKTFDSNYKIEIFDTDGAIIEIYNLTKNTTLEVSTANIKPGTYFLRYVGNSPNNNSVEKLIIE